MHWLQCDEPRKQYAAICMGNVAGWWQQVDTRQTQR